MQVRKRMQVLICGTIRPFFQCLVKNGDFSTEKYHERKKSWRESSLGSHSIVVVA
jgi:hypothetical protein